MFVFYAHGGSNNHGCEAIIRGTCENLRGDKVLYSSDPKADYQSHLNLLCQIKSDTYKRYYKPLKWMFGKIKSSIFHSNEIFKLVNGDIRGVYLSVGGDNYCYPELINSMLTVNKKIREKGNRTILWGASIEPDVLKNRDILSDISKYDFIFARESLTYNALLEQGLQSKTFLYPDPAFAMPPNSYGFRKDVFQNNTVGINISPLIYKYENSSNAVLKNYLNLVQYILDNTDSNILFIPHVIKRNNDDRDAIKKLLLNFNSNRMAVLDNMPADCLKYYISKCSFFIGARTHSTIAAYATNVPTLVVGYSIKARGIARDIFGTEKDYVVDVRNLRNDNELLDSFEKLYEKKDHIRNHLKKYMPEYIAKTKCAVDKLNALIKDSF